MNDHELRPVHFVHDMSRERTYTYVCPDCGFRLTVYVDLGLHVPCPECTKQGKPRRRFTDFTVEK